jgi:hypothetical protein
VPENADLPQGAILLALGENNEQDEIEHKVLM